VGLPLIGFVAALAALAALTVLTVLIIREIRRLVVTSFGEAGIGSLLLAVYPTPVLFAATYYRIAESANQMSGLGSSGSGSPS